jgi:hypothetical protein
MTLKELTKFLQLCRKQGVESIKFQDVEVHFGQLPTKISKNIRNLPETVNDMSYIDPGKIPQIESIDTDELTDEQKLFGSSDPSVWQQPS